MHATLLKPSRRIDNHNDIENTLFIIPNPTEDQIRNQFLSKRRLYVIVLLAIGILSLTTYSIHTYYIPHSAELPIRQYCIQYWKEKTQHLNIPNDDTDHYKYKSLPPSAQCLPYQNDTVADADGGTARGNGDKDSNGGGASGGGGNGGGQGYAAGPSGGGDDGYGGKIKFYCNIYNFI
jgi:uncharacterized membrane protein YgcG